MKESRTGKPTQEELDKLKALMITRQYSSTQLASIMGRTKGSIMGIIWRTPELNQIGLPYKFKPGAKRKSKKIIIKQELIMEGPVTMLQLRDSHCRFPMWGHDEIVGATGLFCAKPRLGNSSYCEAHHRLCIGLPHVSKAVRIGKIPRYA